jgi:hypothetical protein
MTGCYLVTFHGEAEARYLAGIGPPRSATPEAWCCHQIRQWLAGLQHRRAATVPVTKITAELTAILDLIPSAHRPVRGPFAPRPHGGPPMPGRAEYAGHATVRLDRDAVQALAGLPDGDDFKVTFTDAGPVMTVGRDHYPVTEDPTTPS